MAHVKKLGPRTSAEQAARGHDLTGKTVLLTGGNSGLGAETARVLAGIGARVIITSRRMSAGEKTAAAIQKAGPKGSVIVKQLDLADLKSVQALAADISATEPRLDRLILNAGVMACPKSYTKQNFEIQMGTNHFGHFLLSQLLVDKMKAQSFQSRIIVLSSKGHEWGPPEGIDFDDMHWRKKGYKTWTAYGQSKLANVLYAKDLAKRLEGSSVTAYSVHPGIILQTNLTQHIGPMRIPGVPWLASFLPSMKTIPQGSATTVFAATAPGLEAHSGAYLQDCAVSAPNKQGQDPELARKLWASTEDQIHAALAAS
ncbi:hypothetical protein WJX84_009223 [Apatococcus fuscideae]|uniref:Uncharacterized protein n=1 Tax=Apatococcus fuscideae TaxID=2026836 RepID=A0AAW1TDJ5_9CHLO